MSQNNATADRDARDIESELVGTRTRIEHKLELLEDRCRPSAIADYAWRYARSKSEDGTTSRVQQTVVRNPLPVVLMGVGLAWLLLAGREGSVPRAESPLAEGVTEAPRSSEDTAAKDDAKPASAGPASTASGTGTASGSANSGPAEAAHKPQRDRQPRQTSSAENGSSSAMSDKSTTTTSDNARPDKSTTTASDNARPDKSTTTASDNTRSDKSTTPTSDNTRASDS